MNRLGYVWNLTRFAVSRNPLLYLSVAISLFSAGIELLAMSSLMPLFELVAGSAPSGKDIVSRLVTALGFPVTALSLLWAFILLFAIRVLTQLFGQSLTILLGKRVMAQLCSGAFEQIIHRLPIRDVTEKSIGFYISLAGDESFRASTLILSLAQFVSTAALAGLYFAAILAYSPAAAGFVTGFMFCALLVITKIVGISHRLGAKQTTESRRTGSLFLNALNNLKAVRAFSAEKYVVGMHRTAMFNYTRILFWVEEVALLTRLLPVLLLFLIFGIWLVLSGQQVQNIGIAFVVTLIVYLMRFFPVVGQGVTLLMRIASDARSGKDVTSIVQYLSPASSARSNRLNSKLEEIRLCDVCFAYDANAGRMVLQDVNLRFQRGRSYAITGRSGLGKSTLVDILLKFQLPTSGSVLLNSVPISGIPDADVRQCIILVNQEPAIFDDTVGSNICLGLDAPLSSIQKACELACIREFVESMEEGYETRLQYQGSNLSGGQRQRIALARALLRKPDALVLDEATSALDKSTQSQVIDNILREYRDRIVILITHDPQVIERVDEVIDLETVSAATGSRAIEAGNTVHVSSAK
jgi:ABC-type bacteriocin/lantibiotic exporter with double-glycine peptidase domain